VWLTIKAFKVSTELPSHTLPRRGTDYMSLTPCSENEKWKMINDQ